MFTVTRKFTFDAGHRVLGHEGKCRHLHGHTYTAEVTVEAKALDTLGRVIDFSVIKVAVGGWIDLNWDHNFICHEDDALVKIWEWYEDWPGKVKEARERALGREPYIMPDKMNPTAENMAKVLYDVTWQLLAWNDITVTQVRMWETPNCYADFRP